MNEFPGKPSTFAMAQTKYGPIDLASGHWADEAKWIKMFPVPEGWFPGWKVLNTPQVVTHIACNVDIFVTLKAALTEVKFWGLSAELKTFDGCFNIRKVRGSTQLSTHAYGLGLDINAGLNPLNATTTTFSPKFIECWTKMGFDWGGNFKGRKDPMHFSYAWE